MAYQLQSDEPLLAGLQRITQERIDVAYNKLTNASDDRDDDIHSARKCFKQVRAVLRMLRGSLEKETYKEQQARFRDFGRALASLRESFVRMSTMEKLYNDLPEDSATRQLAQQIHEDLQRDYLHIRQSMLYESDVVEEVAQQLQDSKDITDHWNLDAGEGFGLLVKGIKRIHREGSSYRSAATTEPLDMEVFHEWRKRVKYLWYHMRILAPLQPGILDPYIDALDDMGDDLGLDHDLAELQQTIWQYESVDALAVEALQNDLDQRRIKLEKNALDAAGRIYDESTDSFLHRLQGYWREHQRYG